MSSRTPLREEFKKLILLAIPLSIAQGGNALMGLVDFAVVGRLGPTQLAGGGLGNGVFFAVSILGIGVVMGTDPLTSQAVGAGDLPGARGWLWQSVAVALVTALLLCVPLSLLPLSLRHTQIPPAVVKEAAKFILWRIPGIFPLLIFCSQRAYLQAVSLERALIGMTLLAIGVNFLLDLLLVFGGLGIPPLGVPGAAIATDLCSFAEVAYLGWVIARLRIPKLQSRKPQWTKLRQILKVGVPVGLHLFLESAIFTCAGVLAARFGSVPGAAHQIALAFSSVSFTVALGIGTAGSVRVGYAVGAGDTVALRRSGFTALAAGVSFMACSAAVFALLPRMLAGWMTNDAQVIAVAVPLMLPAAVFQISDGAQGIGAGILRGAGDSRYTFWANAVGHYGIGLPLTFYLGISRGLGVVGVWWGLCAGLTVVALLLLLRFARISARPVRRLA